MQEALTHESSTLGLLYQINYKNYYEIIYLYSAVLLQYSKVALAWLDFIYKFIFTCTNLDTEI